MLPEIAVSVPAAGAVLMAYAVRGRSSPFFGPSIWRGPSGKKQIVLTFDDGPSEATPQVLELLDLFSARATFFQCGQNVERLPAISKQVSEAGHEIGNHTYSHPRLPGCSAGRIREEIARTQQAVFDATGVQPSLFRAPYGARWFGLRAALGEHGLTGVMWTVIGYDWEWEAAEIAGHVVSHASEGGIVCLHDGDRTAARVDRRNTVEAMRQILPKLCARGYTFVTAGGMLDQLRPSAKAAKSAVL
ncbi:MAG TPA: polysaccharide deacetylase family protein [Bryobacterales bacterium]|nr:polysaccharide deacetylase family protein [Bryobacterales bacterium]